MFEHAGRRSEATAAGLPGDRDGAGKGVGVSDGLSGLRGLPVAQHREQLIADQLVLQQEQIGPFPVRDEAEIDHLLAYAIPDRPWRVALGAVVTMLPSLPHSPTALPRLRDIDDNAC